MNEFAIKLLDKNRELYEAAKNPLRSHGPDHHERVYRYATILADRLAVKFDDRVLTAAALLHDLAAYYPEETGDSYHEHDSVLAEKAMRELGMSDDEIARASEVIKYHGSDPKYKRDNEPVETKLLRDADKLDVFGPLGCARIVMVRTLKGDTLDQIVDDFWKGGHLERKWNSISYPEARAMAEPDYQYSRVFFKSLQESLNLSV